MDSLCHVLHSFPGGLKVFTPILRTLCLLLTTWALLSPTKGKHRGFVSVRMLGQKHCTHFLFGNFRNRRPGRNPKLGTQCPSPRLGAPAQHCMVPKHQLWPSNKANRKQRWETGGTTEHSCNVLAVSVSLSVGSRSSKKPILTCK